MKTLKLMCLIIILFGLIPISSTWARNGHYHGGWGYYGPRFGIGLGLGYALGYGGYWPYYRGYYPPYYAYPPVIAVPSTPPLYIQRQGSKQPATKLQDNYWYYCRKPEGYYPHVKKCPEGWMQVVPRLSPAQ